MIFPRFTNIACMGAANLIKTDQEKIPLPFFIKLFELKEYMNSC